MMNSTFAEKPYLSQAHANLVSLLYDSKYAKRRDTLHLLLDEFSKANIEWAVACSFGLFAEGIVDDFHDFDLLIAPKSFFSVCKILDRIGSKKTVDKDPSRARFFVSLYFEEYEVNGIDIDVICEFGFRWDDTYTYHHHFNSDEVTLVETKAFGLPDDLKIPVIATEAQLVFYWLMIAWEPKRRFKFDLIAKYLQSNMKRPEFLRCTLQAEYNMPEKLQKILQELLR